MNGRPSIEDSWTTSTVNFAVRRDSLSLVPKTGPQAKVYNGAKHQACGGSKRWSRNDGSTRRTSSFEVALTFRAIQRVQIDSILTVMDAEQILSFDRRYEALSIYQVGMADIVILNKVDLVNEVQLQSVRDYIQRMETSLAVNAPKSEREYITRTVIEWLRQRLPGTS